MAYQLNTVTYGTASAPFLATRCLKQLGLDCQDKRVSEIILHDFFVDDLLSGGDNINEVLNLRKILTSTLASAHFHLRKWKSNVPTLVSETSQSPLDLNIGNNEPSKTLGLGWRAESDELCFPIGILISKINTKRSMLSVMSQIFDPLGMVAPIVISMKMLLQQLWLHKLSWDEPIPSTIEDVWVNIVNKLHLLNNINIPRRIVLDKYELLEFHIFSDASEKAYGACLYVRSIDTKGNIMIRLLIAKSRVAPIKPLTIPRLELCGALLGTRLYERVINSLKIKPVRTIFWTDSTILLGWLKILPSKLHTFVRNRIGEILDKTSDCVWRHVPTEHNPADFISRGVNVECLESLDMWWSGPDFLKETSINWPSNFSVNEVLPETRAEISYLATANDSSKLTKLIDFDRFSNLNRLKRAVAYVLRFKNACRKQLPNEKYLSHTELDDALNVIIRVSQAESFIEYNILINNNKLPNKSPLLKFNVFLDQFNVMRVGGRLGNSDFDYDKKHPILIQSTHRFSKLLFELEHIKLMHAGPQLLLASIRETYWPIGGRNLAKACYRRCVKCSRMKGTVIAPLMGNLPRQRLSSGGYPFRTIGVDYAGPISSASRQGRGCRIVKVYIVIFVCFATKAIHLELVGDLTSNNYLLALRRFISRRGKPSQIYSDNGTTFVGAYNDLAKFLKDNAQCLSSDLANEGIEFHFIPAYSPHFGGIWEAGVKSTKFHLVRVLGNCNLSYEELNTTLVQIEAILNSRPLTPLSSHPEDMMPLTPGHFLIGRPLTSLPMKDLQDNNFTYLNRFHRIEQLRQHFWKRWSKEYISELQLRTKWRTENSPLKIDALVVLKEDNLPPLKWKLGRIVAVHPGSDNVARVADIKTSSGVIRRSFSKICPLPLDDGSTVERQAFNARGHVHEVKDTESLLGETERTV
ncbi:hypothetical protein K1T71_000828 [Dendrolimus kikuchii]|uniref:Uncharacterized protein n=1 Tax=Dendrolimus kikuchii TaxID=765133 RepID=A0ACC1DKN3_9NEOP|nr:hypothetical protein K1T71_000828 [Dendrolimus kikuchii]